MIEFIINTEDKVVSKGYIKLKKLPKYQINFGTAKKPLWRQVHHITKESK